jgi:hypothetical protein
LARVVRALPSGCLVIPPSGAASSRAARVCDRAGLPFAALLSLVASEAPLRGTRRCRNRTPGPKTQKADSASGWRSRPSFGLQSFWEVLTPSGSAPATPIGALRATRLGFTLRTLTVAITGNQRRFRRIETCHSSEHHRASTSHAPGKALKAPGGKPRQREPGRRNRRPRARARGGRG